MRILHQGLVLLVALSATMVAANDLTTIDRRIAKEPQYETKPYYVLIVIGPQAEKRAWLVVDGSVLYIDRNGNGDLTEANERVELDVEATKKINVGGSGEYKRMNVFDIGQVAGLQLRLNFWVLNDDFVPKDDESELLRKYRKERQKNGWANATLWRVTGDGRQAQNPVVFCRRPNDAQISHLAGPLTFQLKWGERQSLERAAKKNVFDVHIGSRGVPTRNSCYPVFSPLTTNEVPAELHPVAHFEFPNKVSDKPPIRVEVNLDQRC